MATIVYLPASSTLPPTISPTVTSSWTASVAGFSRVQANISQAHGSSGDTQINSAIALSAHSCYRQHICPPFNASTTISGTVSAAFSRDSVTFTNSLQNAMVIRVLQADGVTVRGTCLAESLGAFFAGVSRNSDFYNAVAITSVTASPGDYLVIETGLKDTNAGDTGNIWYSDSLAADLSTTAQSTAVNNPIVNFSATFAANFGPWPSGANQLMMVGVGL